MQMKKEKKRKRKARVRDTDGQPNGCPAAAATLGVCPPGRLTD